VALIGAGATAGLAFPSPAFAGTFNIACGDVYGPSGLVAAMNAANGSGGGTINLASGCIYALTTFDNGTSFGLNGLPVVNSPITLNGAGARINRIGSHITPLFRIFEVDRAGNLTLNGLPRRVRGPHDRLEITGGNSQDGGAILNVNGTLSLDATQVSDNTATDPLSSVAGGGISNLGGTTTLNNSQVIHNTATQFTVGASGGGIYNGGTLTVNNSEVNNNTASAPHNAVNAAGIDDAGTLTMNGSQVDDNAATAGSPGAFGGGLCVCGGTATLNMSAVNNNTVTAFAPDAIAAGAGIANFNTLKLNFTLVRGNTTTGTTAQGGGLWNNGGTVTSFFGLLQGNTVSTGLGTAVGGGIFTNGGSVTLQSSADLGNAASGPGADGGGIENIGSTVTLGSTPVVANVPNNCRPPGSVPGCIG
jgi:hypothetical protein